MSDVLERLQDIAENGYAEDGEVDGVAVSLLREAAAEIARLRAENAALRAQVSELNLEKLALIDAAEIAELPGIGLGERGA